MNYNKKKTRLKPLTYCYPIGKSFISNKQKILRKKNNEKNIFIDKKLN